MEVPAAVSRLALLYVMSERTALPVRLSEKTLKSLAGRASVPDYDRSTITPGILHFGVGNFHRSHQAVFLDNLFRAGEGHDWGIIGAGVLPSDEGIRRTLAEKDYLTTIVERSASSSVASVTGSMIGFLSPDEPEGIIAALADPIIRIVSLTITEGGYFIDAVTGGFDPTHPDILADVAAPESPRTVFGLMVRGLALRRAAGQPPFTVMSCDNIPHNGDVTRTALIGLARLIDPELADWIQVNVTFPNGMVDRITPATGDRERQILRDEFGIEDAAPVFCEDFKQWVLEDNFTSGRPALDHVGVEFVADVSPYELMKIRILNGGHALLAYPAGLLDIQFAHDAMANPLISGYLNKVERDEIIPTLPGVPGTDFQDYLAEVLRRFANPNIADTIQRLCLDGSNRQPKFIVPTIIDRIAANQNLEGLALGSALWCRYCYGETESGVEIAANDADWARLSKAARLARHEPQQWLALEDIYGEGGRDPAFSQAFAGALTSIWTDGTAATLARYIGS